MCGSSQNQNNINNAQIQFMDTLTAQYQQEFAQNQEILNTLTSSLQPIINGGPSQEGYSPQELAALNTQATQQAGQAYAQAKQATDESIAAKGGGDLFVPSGATQQVDADLDISAENNLSNQKLNILQSDYATGLSEYESAIGALSGVPGAIDNASTGAAGAVTNSSNAAANEANAITEANNSWMGLLGGVAGAALGTGGVSSFFPKGNGGGG
ncbi:MAG TPA: hypothetical protein VHU83_06635 [Bryobacteraceae bacterium]|jgi:hypothetical protein|nr:hypothetical protein [Bryobacteraceae bacterium]